MSYHSHPCSRERGKRNRNGVEQKYLWKKKRHIKNHKNVKNCRNTSSTVTGDTVCSQFWKTKSKNVYEFLLTPQVLWDSLHVKNHSHLQTHMNRISQVHFEQRFLPLYSLCNARTNILLYDIIRGQSSARNTSVLRGVTIDMHPSKPDFVTGSASRTFFAENAFASPCLVTKVVSSTLVVCELLQQFPICCVQWKWTLRIADPTFQRSPLRAFTDCSVHAPEVDPTSKCLGAKLIYIL